MVCKGCEVKLIAWFYEESKQGASEMFTFLLRFIAIYSFSLSFPFNLLQFPCALHWVRRLGWPVAFWRHSGVLAMLMFMALCPILNANFHTAHDPKWSTPLRHFFPSFFDRGHGYATWHLQVIIMQRTRCGVSFPLPLHPAHIAAIRFSLLICCKICCGVGKFAFIHGINKASAAWTVCRKKGYI